MLTAMRNRSKGLVAKIIMALLIVSFAVWGIGDMLVSRPEQAEAARVGKVSISRLAVEQEMQRDIAQLRQRLGEQYKPELVQMLNIPGQVAGRMVSQELLRQESEALGIVASDAMVADVLRTDTMFHNEAGEFDKQRFLQILRQNGMAERDFVNLMREDISRRLIGQVVSGSFGVPDIAVKVVQAAEKETREVTLYEIVAQNLEIEAPGEEELAAYYQSVSDRYVIPEYRSVSYVTINETAVKDAVSVSNEDIRELYEERIEEYTQPQTRDIQLLLYDDEETAQKAKALLDAGESSSTIAKKLPPLNASTLEVKGTTEAQLTEEMGPVVFGLSESEVSEPIATGFGFHVIKLDRINAPKVKSLAEVEVALRNELEGNLAGELLTKKADTLEDLVAGGSSLKEAATELGLTLKQVPAFDQTGKSPGNKNVKLPALKNFALLAFSTGEGEASAITLGKPGEYYMVSVDQVIVEELPPIETVKSELVKSWKASRRDTLEMNHAGEIAGKLADGVQREEVLASGAVKMLKGGKLSRSDLKLGGIELPAPLVQSIFAVEVDAVTDHNQLQNGKRVVAIVGASELPPLSETVEGEAAQTVRSNIQINQQQEMMEQLMGYLYEKYDAVIHQDVLQQIRANDS